MVRDGVSAPLWQRGFRSAASAAALGACFLVAVAPSDASARTQSISQDVRLTLTKKSGLSFEHRGSAGGTFAGSVRSKMTMDALSMEGLVTITTRDGSVKLKIRGIAKSGGLRSKFDGTGTIAGGTGRFRKARGKGKFSGTVNRQTWAVSLRATGTISY